MPLSILEGACLLLSLSAFIACFSVVRHNKILRNRLKELLDSGSGIQTGVEELSKTADLVTECLHQTKISLERIQKEKSDIIELHNKQEYNNEASRALVALIDRKGESLREIYSEYNSAHQQLQNLLKQIHAKNWNGISNTTDSCYYFDDESISKDGPNPLNFDPSQERELDKGNIRLPRAVRQSHTNRMERDQNNGSAKSNHSQKSKFFKRITMDSGN